MIIGLSVRPTSMARPLASPVSVRRPDCLTQYIVTRAGLKPGEFSLLPVGAHNACLAAIQQDQIQAGVTTEPTVGQLVRMGAAKVMIDLRTPQTTTEALGGLYQCFLLV